jgi:carbonic anhydrase
MSQDGKMDHIIDGVLTFQREVFPNDKALFHELATGQAPQTMFIGCSDSRVVPELVTQQGPGGLFVVRNAGNIIPPGGPEPGGVTASIEYAVEVLQVRDIVVCGHSSCGAMTALMNGIDKLQNMPAVARWLHYADGALAGVADVSFVNEASKLDAIVHENVLTQLDNLLTHRSVKHAVEAGKLRLHGWVFDIATGGVETYDADAHRFIAISSAQNASATPSGQHTKAE